MTTPILQLVAARSEADNLPRSPLDLSLAAGDFALIETPGQRRGTALADLCIGLAPLVSGQVRFRGRDWATLPAQHADALRGHVGRLFHTPLRPDTPNVAERVMLRRLHHTRLPREAVLAEASALAMRFGLPGLPAGPARLLTEPDLLRAACVRAFLGAPDLVLLELSPAAQGDDLVQALLAVGAEARGRGACVVWLVGTPHRLRDRSIRPSHRLRLADVGLIALNRAQVDAT